MLATEQQMMYRHRNMETTILVAICIGMMSPIIKLRCSHRNTAEGPLNQFGFKRAYVSQEPSQNKINFWKTEDESLEIEDP